MERGRTQSGQLHIPAWYQTNFFEPNIRCQFEKGGSVTGERTGTDQNGYVTLIESNDWRQSGRHKIRIILAVLFIPLVRRVISVLRKEWKRSLVLELVNITFLTWGTLRRR
mmetsp:Transcript_6087/g.10198  ORF Transcript_6087/g.10198 Transcript_6087/m.10198 type:complete len:111 (+) Transcript_6087:364-696(+)